MSVTQRLSRAVSFIRRYQFLLYELTRRDFKKRYRRSYLGSLWSVVTPFLTMMILYMVFSNLFGRSIENYALYLICGQLFYSFYGDGTSRALESIISNRRLIRKVSLPRLLFPLSITITSGLYFVYSLPAIFLLVFIMKGGLNPQCLLVVVPVILLFVFVLGVGILLSALTVRFRDLVHLYKIFLRALRYGTPLFYPETIVPDKYRFIIDCNPLYYYIRSFRELMYYDTSPTWSLMAICAVLSGVSLLFGIYVFKKQQGCFALNI